MKNLFYIVVILFVMSCKNTTKNISSKKTIIIDTVSTTELPQIKTDTLIKISKPFDLNNILCYWENYYITNSEEINMILKNYKTKELILETSLNDVDLIVHFNSDEYFIKLNETYFEDLNFDGFKDFYYYSRGSNEMTSLTNIYLFNNQSKTFEYSEYLSASHIEDIDKKTRKLVTENSGMDYGITNTHYFDKFGKLKYTEVVTEYFNPYVYKIYEKRINGEVVKRDSTFIRKE